MMLFQVKQIRLFLKSFRRPDLRLVNVETVQNIQGNDMTVCNNVFSNNVFSHGILDINASFRLRVTCE